MNRIGDLYKEHSIDPDGALLRNPQDSKDPYGVRFSPDRIWLHYTPIDSLKYVVDTAPEWIKSIARDLEVKRFSRLGLRSEFFEPYKNLVKASTELSKRFSSELLQGMIAEVDDPADTAFQYVVRVPLKQYIAGIRITFVRITREPLNPGEFSSDGLLFDLDTYRRRKPPKGLSQAE